MTELLSSGYDAARGSGCWVLGLLFGVRRSRVPAGLAATGCSGVSKWPEVID